MNWDYALERLKTRGLRLLACVFATGALSAIAAYAVWGRIPCDSAACPTVADVASGRVFGEAIHIYDRVGAPLASVGGPRRRFVRYEEIPPLLRDGFVTVEDRRFWKHGGVDYHAVGRALVSNLAEGSVVEGASTIPMQLVRTIWSGPLSSVGPWRRKLIEARMAPRLVARLGHEGVLELYLNGIYLGDGTYGVGSAARHYFDRPLDSLDISQVALLVGLARTPGRYNPRLHPARAERRRNVVLSMMRHDGLISPLEEEFARARPVATTDSTSVSFQRTYVTAAVRRELRHVAPELVGLPGLRVFTTIDAGIQRAAETALTEQLAAIEAGRYGTYLGPPPASAGDSTAAAERLQGAAIAVDSRTGGIQALVGGRDFGSSELDRSMQSRRQVGSLVKPFLLAAAYQDGFEPSDPVSTDTVLVQTDEGVWSPADHVAQDTIPLRQLVVQSSNRAAVRVGRQIGLQRLDGMARALGMRRSIARYPSSFLGAFEASLVEMTSAFAAFGNGGWQVRPHLITRVESAEGEVLYERFSDLTPVRALDPAIAWLVLDAMRGVVDHGTAWRVRRAYQGAAAGKTGTSDGGRDAWFVGVRPGLAAGIWVGFDLPRPIVQGGSGGTLAAPAWGRWMAAIPDSLEWHAPEGVSVVRLNPATGQVLSAGCPRRTFARDIAVRERYAWQVEYRGCPDAELPERLLRGSDLTRSRTISMPELRPLRARGGNQPDG